ncbi:hypothetical protein HYV10_03480 [Candidatus Dependentiae bacterium]|nr:hypothetical protein [Candidatus Dependentiae bacterium]
MELKKHSQDLALLHRLGGVSLNIASNHHLENLSEFVLHDVCSEDLFRVVKAAYLVKNPDFACMKGVAGYSNQENFIQGHTWQNQKDFTSHMRNSLFNQKVRQINETNIPSKIDLLDKKRLHKLSDHLEIERPEFHLWKMKYDNQGILIFEKEDQNDLLFQHLPHFISMLSFCPVF